MRKQNEIAIGLDVGSAWTRVFVLSVEGGVMRYAGHGVTQSKGWHRGQISDQTAVADSIRDAVEAARKASGYQIESAVVGVGGPAIRAQQGRGVYDFGHSRRIGREDLAYAVKLAALAPREDDRALLQVLPQDFTVDGQPPTLHPVNVECLRLEAHTLLITASAQEHQTLLSAVQQARIDVEETVFEAMAAAYACVLADERAGGVAVLDIGAHSSGLVFYDGDSALYAIGMPFSGEHFTRDISEVKAMSLDESEDMKIKHGCALLGLTADNIVIELPPMPGRPGRELSRRDLIEILEARATQIFQYVERFRVDYSRGMSMHEGIVLCGGATQMEGIVEVAERVLGCQARLGFVRGVDQIPEELATPEWTTAAGLAMYSARLKQRKGRSAGPRFLNLFSNRA
ncbi:MAG: cell division protein FtsA [Bryobacteraceae bacterium]|nr:cell division protein FtsA [Bryobacteraceae bacterium]